MHTPATAEVVTRAIEALKANGFEPTHVPSKEKALETIRGLIPDGASVMNGASETLQEIGLIDYLQSGEHPWKNLHDAILAEKDEAKQAQLRREAVVSDFYLGSAHALTETGELVFASNSGSQLPHLAFTSPHVVLVIGSNKIVPSVADAFERLRTHVVPREDERMKRVYGFGTTWAKTLIMHKENPAFGRAVRVLVVDAALGF